MLGVRECEKTVGIFDLVAKIDESKSVDIVPSILKIDEVRKVTPLDCPQIFA